MVAEPTREQVQDFEARRADAQRQFAALQPKQVDFGKFEFVPEPEDKRLAREQRQRARAEHKLHMELSKRYGSLVAAAGDRYRECTLDNYRCKEQRQRKIVEAIREYITQDVRESIVLYGPVGTGKDHLAFSVCREAIHSGRTVGWINGQTWFGMVRDAMDTSKSEESLIAEFRRPELLCLSDPLPPVGPLTPHQCTMLYRLVDARYSLGLPTVCTINVKDDNEADERMGAATWDRLCHGSWKMFCSWDTYRKAAREI